MQKYKVLKAFEALKERKHLKEGDIIELTPERFDEITENLESFEGIYIELDSEVSEEAKEDKNSTVGNKTKQKKEKA